MHRPVSRVMLSIVAAAAMLGLSTLTAATALSAPASAPGKAPVSITGTWFQEAPPAHFRIKPGTRPGQVVLTIPAELMPLPVQDYVLTRKDDTTWTFTGENLPTVTFTLTAANKATLNLRGKGKTAKGPWFVYQVMDLTRVP